MATWESNGHVTPICLVPIISETARDRNLVTMEHLYEMATWESNGHVTVTLSDPERSKGRDPNTLRGRYLENVWR